MKIDTGIMGGSYAEIGVRARELEALGYDGLMTAETAHDPFLPLAIAAEHTERIELATGIAVAFARTPMVTRVHGQRPAARARSGRFILGLGSQIKPHIEKRFSMPWSHPAAPHARVHPRDARDLGVVERRREARLPAASSTATR